MRKKIIISDNEKHIKIYKYIMFSVVLHGYCNLFYANCKNLQSAVALPTN